MDRWPLFSRFGSRILPRFHYCLKGWRQLTQDLVPRLVPPLLCLSAVIAASEIGMTTKKKGPRWVGPHGPHVGEENLEFRLPCSSKDVRHSNRFSGAQPHVHVPNASQWGQHRSGARFQYSGRSAKPKWMTSLSPLPLRNTLETLAQLGEVLMTKQLHVFA